jgi:hypothetical protein
MSKMLPVRLLEFRDGGYLSNIDLEKYEAHKQSGNNKRSMSKFMDFAEQ